MTPREFILRKRSGGEHSPAELKEFLEGYLAGEIQDYQVSSWLMAVFFRGMAPSEMREWTRLMWKSGTTLPRRGREDYWIDKHSTGGVGDKTSLILVPWVACTARRLFGEFALRLPMVSGRGLGHTGGTLDKLEAIPGFSPRVPIDRAVELLRTQGYVMMGQTDEMAPADRLLYALRDVTGTVESLPLIVSSILSKKLSENLDGLVLDVKFGSGAFMKTRKEAEALARALIETAKAQGVATVALLTRMEEPLGWKVGNQLEIEECADFLAGERPEAGLKEVTSALAAWMLRLASRGKLSLDSAREELDRELSSRRPFEEWARLVRSQGGDWSAFERSRRSVPAGYRWFECPAPRSGCLTSVNAEAVGSFVTGLGGGRRKKEDAVDFRVGVELFKKVGDEVRAGETVARVLARETDAGGVGEWFGDTFGFGGTPSSAGPLVEGVIE